MTEYADDLEVERSMKDRFMTHHAESPFVSARIDGFHGLRYFPIDERYRVEARLERVDPPRESYLRTNRDGQATMRYLGDLVFMINGVECRLRLFHAGEGVGTSAFVPFRDGTSGTESYGPGRYLTLDLTEDDRYELDFNRSFNPYCAYTDAYECPFPPAENDLPVPVPAGEQAWSDDRNPATPQTAMRTLRSGGTAAKPKVTPRKSASTRAAAPRAARRRPRVAARPSRKR